MKPVHMLSVLLATLLLSSGMAQESWPPQRVTLMTHSSAGGGGDVMMRNLGRALENKYGITTIVDNRTGGSGAVALSYLATQAPADGSLIMAVTPTQLITPLRSEGIPGYQDVTPIARLFMDPSAIFVHNDSPFQTMDEFIEHARANPRDLTVGIGSAGSLDQLILQEFQETAGVEVRTVPHEGGGDALVALLGQHVDAVVSEPGDALTHLESGELRMLGVFQEERLDNFPDVPTLQELGHDVVSTKFRGVFGPPSMSPEMAEAIAAELQNIYEQEPFRSYYLESSIDPAFLGPEEFRSFLDEANEELRVFLESLQ